MTDPSAVRRIAHLKARPSVTPPLDSRLETPRDPWLYGVSATPKRSISVESFCRPLLGLPGAGSARPGDQPLAVEQGRHDPPARDIGDDQDSREDDRETRRRRDLVERDER